VKYASSVLGYLWSVLDPLMMAVVYWFVFTKIFVRSVGEDPYIVFLLAAMLPWQWANGSLRASTSTLDKDAKLIRSTNLPREIWVLRLVGSKFVEYLFTLPVLALFAVIFQAELSWYAVLWPLAVVLQTILLVGCGLVLAPVSALFSDVERLMRIAMRLLFFASPVLYGLSDVQNRIPSAIADFYVLNPLVGILELYRVAFFPGEWVGWTPVGVSALISLLVFGFGLWVFHRLEGRVLKEI
jgi:ABC-2 type transport system permease protein